MLTSSTRVRQAAFAGAITILAIGSPALAFQALPSGGVVNDDLAAGINKTISVSGEEPTNADVAAGALTAGQAAIPWAIFRQQEVGGAHDQVFSRSFAGGSWITQGTGTVGGRSSSSPLFSGSLNFDQGIDGEAPSIDFAGSGRTVPWASWYENTSGAGFSNNNIFASHFDNTGDANQGKWIFAGQGRGMGGGSVPVPSLNIHTNQDAQNPSVAGGSAADPSKPVPWVTWQETTTAPVNGEDQIFAVRSIGPGATNCEGVTPAGVAINGHVPAIGGICWQQTGIPRVGPSTADPSLNIDPTRNGLEPDIAFAGSQDEVPWVVWYETGSSNIPGLHDNEMVFAAKAVSDATAEGGFHWVAVGSQLSATLDKTGANGFGSCADSATGEAQCSLNENPSADAENPRVAAGAMTATSPTVPWVAWDEDVAGVKQVFLSRLVGIGASAHFEVLNGGKPILGGTGDSTRPDITFSGNTPYVSWREDVGGGAVRAVFGHIVNPANPTFVLDEDDVPLTPTAQTDVREPISSSCLANPFNADGASCQGGALGTPFFLFTNGTSPISLFAGAYQPGVPLTGAASSVSSSSATLGGSINPGGAAANVAFEYGTTTAYGQSTPAQSTGVSDAVTPFTAQLAGLPTGVTIHYRAVAMSDFGKFAGADQTLSTSPLVPPSTGSAGPTAVNAKFSAAKANVSGSSVSVRISCIGAAGATCRMAFKLTVIETLQGHRLIAVTARSKRRKTHKVVVVGTASITLGAGRVQTVRFTLNHVGKRLLSSRHELKAKLQITQQANPAKTTTVTQIVTFKTFSSKKKPKARS